MKTVSLSSKIVLSVAGMVVSGASLSQTAAIKADAFAYHTEIKLPANGGPFYQVPLSLPVYQGIKQENLGDLRVFNSAGETVPYTLMRSQPTSTAQDKSTDVAIFSVTAGKDVPAKDDDVALNVKRKADGTLIAVNKRPQSGKQIEVTQGAIFDISQIKEHVRALHLQIKPSPAPFHGFSLETGDDLQQWHSLLDDAQIVHLQQDGQVIDKDTFEWEGEAGKYLRLVWRDPEQAPVIVGANVLSTHTSTSSARMLWTDPLQPQKTEGNHYDYALPGHLPVEQLRIGLAQTNALAPFQVQRYLAPTAQRQQATWETIAQGVAFRLQSPQGEVHSPDIVLDTMPVDSLRLAFDGNGSIGNTAPSLQTGFVPQVLVFLSRGQGPFTLAWGSKTVADGSMEASTLMPDYSANAPLTASPATLQPVTVTVNAALPETEKAPDKASKGVLWAILGVGLGVLAGMVSKLFKQIKQGKTEK